MHPLALEDARHAHHILIAGIGAGADEHLVHRDGPHGLHGFHIVGHMGLGHQGKERIQADFDGFVVGRAGIGGQGLPVRFPILGLEEGAGHFIAGEYGGGGAQFRAHVGDGGTLGHGEGGHAGAGVFHHPAHAALDAQPAQHLQDDVLGGHAIGQFAGQVHVDHPGAGEIIRSAAHGHRHVQSARADGQHADAATRGGVAVAAQQRPAGNAVALQVHLVADTVAGLGAPDAVLVGHGLDILVVVRVFKACLQGVMVNIRHGALGAHPLYPHSFELQIGHGARGVLGQGLIDADGDFLPGDHLAADQVGCENLLSQIHHAGCLRRILPFAIERHMDCIQ